ncbi:MAG: hypothetical protein HW388_912, partial [Dehalococcoidia bacterium]|nr:hypothetical protein [Dehalococcoidia bacterium]
LSGAEGIRTPDPLLAKQVLSRLSYSPVGLLEAIPRTLTPCIPLSLGKGEGEEKHLGDTPRPPAGASPPAPSHVALIA